jgi:hypothetical protein
MCGVAGANPTSAPQPFQNWAGTLEVWIQVSVDDAVLWITKYMYMHKTPGDLDIVTVVIAPSR